MATDVEVGDWLLAAVDLLDGCEWKLRRAAQVAVYAQVTRVVDVGYRSRKNHRRASRPDGRVVWFRAMCCTGPRCHGKLGDHEHNARESQVRVVLMPRTVKEIQEFLGENTR